MMTADRAGQQRLARTLVLGALRNPLSVPALSPPDLDLTLRLMRRLRLLGRLAWQLRAAGVLDSLPDVVTDQLLGALVLCESRVRSARWELDRLAWALRDRGNVPLVALKGCAYLLACTPNSLGRTFADVDLLVPEEHLLSVEMRLRDYGWAGKEITPYDDLYYRRWAHELPPMLHAEREVEVDLHHGILMRTARLKPSPVLLFESAREVQGSPYEVLAPVDMVLHAIVHLFHGGEMDDALRDLVDIDELLTHFAATEAGFWSTFWGRAEALDLARPAYYGLRYAEAILGTRIPANVASQARAGAPLPGVLSLMDQLVPRALFPQHPDHPGGLAGPQRLLLYIHSHWVKMPPAMLARHLAHKTYARYIRRQGGDVEFVGK
jgi:hypothetical protein